MNRLVRDDTIHSIWAMFLKLKAGYFAHGTNIPTNHSEGGGVYFVFTVWKNYMKSPCFINDSYLSNINSSCIESRHIPTARALSPRKPCRIYR